MLNSDAFFFLKKRFGYTMHIVVDSGAKEYQECKWYEMQFKEDFHRLIKNYKMIPSSELQVKFELIEYAKLRYMMNQEPEAK